MKPSTPAVDKSNVLLEVSGLKVTFGRGERRTEVVHGVDFTLLPGEKLALVGESGSGKSVTALSILRLHDPDQCHYAGSIRLLGEELLSQPESALRRVRGAAISMVFQEPMTSLNPTYTVGDQLIEPLLLHNGLDKGAARARAIELLERVGITQAATRLDAYPHTLSGGQRQRVMIAMALACRPKLLIADEPTTALDVTIQRQILALLDELQQEFGLAVLLITHDLNLVRAFADRVCVMQRGVLVETAPVAQLFSAPQHPYSRHLLASQPERLIDAPLEVGAPTLLSCRDLKVHFPMRKGLLRRPVNWVRAVDGVDLELRRGETLGLVGESGSGKSTLGFSLLRLQSAQGEIHFEGASLHDKSNRQMRPLRRALQLVFQDPYSSLSPRMTVEQIISEGLQLHYPALSRAERRARCERVMQEVGLEVEMLERYPHEFSGGQRQRIAIARVVVLEPSLILLDEPTSALDVSVQKQVLALLRDLQRRHGMSYLFITHDLKVISAIAHRVLVMQAGRVVESGDTEQIFTDPQHPYTRTLLEAALI